MYIWDALDLIFFFPWVFNIVVLSIQTVGLMCPMEQCCMACGGGRGARNFGEGEGGPKSGAQPHCACVGGWGKQKLDLTHVTTAAFPTILLGFDVMISVV